MLLIKKNNPLPAVSLKEPNVCTKVFIYTLVFCKTVAAINKNKTHVNN